MQGDRLLPDKSLVCNFTEQIVVREFEKDLQHWQDSKVVIDWSIDNFQIKLW